MFIWRQTFLTYFSPVSHFYTPWKRICGIFFINRVFLFVIVVAAMGHRKLAFEKKEEFICLSSFNRRYNIMKQRKILV